MATRGRKPILFSLDDAASFCGVTAKTIKVWVKNGKIAPHEANPLYLRRSEVIKLGRAKNKA